MILCRYVSHYDPADLCVSHHDLELFLYVEDSIIVNEIGVHTVHYAFCGDTRKILTDGIPQSLCAILYGCIELCATNMSAQLYRMLKGVTMVYYILC